jgi:polyhydroxybutyrate depolymerase
VCALSLCLLAACHLFRAPTPALPSLSAGIHAGTLRVQERERSYLLYMPRQRRAGAPLVVLLHGSRQTAEGLRRATGYAFDRLADEHGFVAVYPDGYKRRWNDCRAGGRYPARKLQVDDVGYILSLVDLLKTEAGIDPRQVFLAGYSGGGQLAFRIALQRPERVAGIASFGANLPTPENWACEIAGKPVAALLINGTRDRINPYQGGKVSVFGFASRGTVLSSHASAEYFANLAGLHRFEEQRLGEAGETWIEQRRWYQPGSPEIMLITVHGGGHVVPGPSAAFPRILGKVSGALDGPREVWNFFARQRAGTQGAESGLRDVHP